MNDTNLIPMNQRSKNEARETGRKGGLKSGETRRRNRDIKKIVAAFLQAAPDAATAERLAVMGIEDADITNKAGMVLAMYDAAMKGNVKAFETLMKYSGEDPEQQRKDLELQMQRDRHIIVLNDKEYQSGLSFDLFKDDREKQYALNDIKNQYKELKNAQETIIRERSSNAFYDDDEDAER